MIVYISRVLIVLMRKKKKRIYFYEYYSLFKNDFGSVCIEFQRDKLFLE